MRAVFTFRIWYFIWLGFSLMTYMSSGNCATTPSFTEINQGNNWKSWDRERFYTLDQGSRIMPSRWIKALKQANGQPFMADSLSRYGYLPNDNGNIPNLPVGFNIAVENGEGVIGMTCAACHTRQIEVGDKYYRIDGGPAIVDFQSFASDLDDAVNSVLTDDNKFSEFARDVLWSQPTPDEKAKLRKALSAWHKPYQTIMRALPKDKPWGPARLDAVGMIFNRLTGLDIGPAPNFIINDNIHKADAPVRYPFIWNAPNQDLTQWPGFADNGSDLLGLARNLGEVYGVFAVFHPEKEWRPLGVNYLKNNSANFDGLKELEDLVRKIGPPKWPWEINSSLAVKGKEVFDKNCANGCHEKIDGITRFPNKKTWCTPIQDVKTDSRQYDLFKWTVKTGVLSGAKVPFLSPEPLKDENESPFNVLKMAVLGSIVQYYSFAILDVDIQGRSQSEQLEQLLSKPGFKELKGAFHAPDTVHPSAEEPMTFEGMSEKCGSRNNENKIPKYESRVLEGIWATAPYLHNGSVPSLAELLKPATERVASFKVGPNYDLQNIGLAVEQAKFNYMLETTADCKDSTGKDKWDSSGNSRCGHEYGTTLPPDEKQALLEYLKTL